jgi:putative transcriptional regulator
MSTRRMPGHLHKAILETAEGMHRAGIMNHATFRKINVRQLSSDALPTAEPISGEEIPLNSAEVIR